MHLDAIYEGLAFTGHKTGAPIMPNSLSRLIEMARAVTLNKDQREEQRRSFVYGNTAIENDTITREMVNERAASSERSND
jgi:3-hydroxymyristoyl/3-hydroxydecanoyl-(acyl carrier protein) dehydratase